MVSPRNDKIRVFPAITAAGESKRMGQPKPLLRLGDRTFLEIMIDSCRAAGLPSRPAVVIGAAAEVIIDEVRRLDGEPLMNLDYRSGRFASIRVAARWAHEKARQEEVSGALLLWPVDCPAVNAETLRRLCVEAASFPGNNIVPTFDGRAGHPVILCGRFIDMILSASEEANLRDLIRDNSVERRVCPVNDPAVLDNLNRPEDYALFLQNRAAVPEGKPNDDEARRLSGS